VLLTVRSTPHYRLSIFTVRVIDATFLHRPLDAEGILLSGCACVHASVREVCKHDMLQTAHGIFTKFTT